MEGTKQNIVPVVDDHPAIRETMNDILKEKALPNLPQMGRRHSSLVDQDFDLFF